MREPNHHQASKTITVVALLFALLIVLLPHPHHLSISMASPLLVMVFLSGTIDVPVSLWHLSRVSKECSLKSPDLPSRFQQPPPALF
jgi:hypothetical protein